MTGKVDYVIVNFDADENLAGSYGMETECWILLKMEPS